MSYKVLIKKQARKKLAGLPTPLKVRIAEKINALGHNPEDSRLNIKKLKGQPCYRLRAGDWRIIFDRDDYLKIISIEALKSRGDAYK